jgi:hypothetical protein
MALNGNMSLRSAGRILDRLRMSGKKTAVSGALLSIMLFMWVRVFIGHRPAAAAAAPPSTQTETVLHKTPVKVKRVELPKTPGWHDTIQRDFFTVKDRTYFRRNSAGRNTGTEKEVPVALSNDPQEVIQRIAQTLKLEAVAPNETPPRAYLNDQLLEVGGRLRVKDGADVFEFEVLQIHVNSVLVECNGIQLTLELAQFPEVVN